MSLLTAKDVAAYLKIGKSTVYEWAALGIVPCIKFNGLLRFDEDELKAWLAQCKQQGRSPAAAPASLANEATANKVVSRVAEKLAIQRRGA